MTEYTSRWGRLASSDEVKEFEESRINTESTLTIICGDHRWKVHSDLFFSEIGRENILLNGGTHAGNGDGSQEKAWILLQDENVFIVARLLQYVYYGTYTTRSYDLIQDTDNLTRPGFIGFSPVMMVRAGITTESEDSMHSAFLSRDNDTTISFAQDIHTDLYKLAVKYKLCGLHDEVLERYSTYPFRNHREFYQSVIDTWPLFPLIEEISYDSRRLYYDRDVLRAVAPHIVKFWKEARRAERHASGVEGRRMLKWIKGKRQAVAELLAILWDVSAGI